MENNYIALAIPAFFIFIMIELLVARWQGKNYYRFNDSITDLSCGIGQQATALLLKGFLYAGYIYVYQHYAIWRLPSNSMAAWVIAFFGIDIGYYWWHRLSHEVNFMWAIHVVHHQSEDYNLAVALRQAWFSGISIWIFYLPVVLLGVDPTLMLAMGEIGRAHV